MFSINDRVRHEKYGEGRIVKFIDGKPLVDFGRAPYRRVDPTSLTLLKEEPTEISAGLGIGRIGDVDPALEQEAAREAVRIQARQVARDPHAYTPTRTCAICGAPADMMASFGPACPDHYDELSD